MKKCIKCQEEASILYHDECMSCIIKEGNKDSDNCG